MHTVICDEIMNQMQEKVRRYMTDKPEYRQQNLNYMRYEMKMMEQEDLIDQLKEMNLKELQYCQGAGVPGHANTIVLQLIKQRKQQMTEYLESKGSERIEEVDAEIPQQPDATVSSEDKKAWKAEDLALEEGLENAKQPIHTSKKGRESDSEAV